MHPNLSCLMQKCHTEGIGVSKRIKGKSQAMTVGIGFHHAQDLAVWRVVPYTRKIVAQCLSVEQDAGVAADYLGPELAVFEVATQIAHGAACGLDGDDIHAFDRL